MHLWPYYWRYTTCTAEYTPLQQLLYCSYCTLDSSVYRSLTIEDSVPTIKRTLAPASLWSQAEPATSLMVECKIDLLAMGIRPHNLRYNQPLSTRKEARVGYATLRTWWGKNNQEIWSIRSVAWCGRWLIVVLYQGPIRGLSTVAYAKRVYLAGLDPSQEILDWLRTVRDVTCRPLRLIV